MPIEATLEATLAAIVDADPASARILERHHLDYCCGGTRRLADACETQGVDAMLVLGELAELAQQADQGPGEWTTMGPAELVDHLEATHHRYLHEELPRLGALLDKVLGVHGGRHPELGQVRASFAALRGDLEPHLVKEEQILFPMIRELASATESPSFHCGSLANPIGVMLLDHDQAGVLLAQLRAATDGYQPPSDACASYQTLYRGLEELEADTHLHVHKENNVLFPAVIALEARLSGGS